MKAMVQFLAVYAVFYGALHAYAFSLLRRAFGPRAPDWRGFAIGSLLMIALPVLARALEVHHAFRAAWVASLAAYAWGILLFWFVCAGLATDVWNLPFRALALRVPTARAAVIPARFPARLVACAAIPALLWGAYEARRIRLNTIAIATHRLPAGARSVRIVQLSDLHLGLFVREAALERILARVREANPDMIAVTGDLLDSSPDNSAPLLPALRALDPPLGKFAVLGNHEFYAGPERCAEFLRAAGFRVLRAERETVKTDGVAVCVAGVDDAEGRRIGAVSRDDERAALTANADRPFTLLLKHQPRITAGVLDRFDLQLSGHTHGGQVFPFQALVRLFYPEAGVLHEVGAGRWLYGSRGAGTWGPPIRLFATPEVTCFAVGPATDGHLRDGGAGKGAGRRGGTAQ